MGRLKVGKINKYKNKIVNCNGLKFHSKKEANRYKELKLLEHHGSLQDLELQPKFELMPKINTDGYKIRKMTYIADFRYKEFIDGVWVDTIEDVKGFKTQVYKIKRSFFIQKYIIGKDEIRFIET